MRQFLVYDLGGTLIKYALMNEEGNVIEQGKVPAATDSLDHLLDVLSKVASGYKDRFEGVAVSMPGRIDTRNGFAFTGGAFRFMQNVPFAGLLSDRVGTDVVIANDGKCAAKAEAAKGALKDVENGAVVVLGTGTGGGIVLNHDVWMGQSGGAGEFSTLVSDLWTIASNGYDRGRWDTIYAGYGSATGLITRYAEAKGIPVQEALQTINGIKFFEAYDAGEKEAIDTLEVFGMTTAVGIVSIQCVLDLQRFAIGGGISARKEVTDVIRNGVEKLFSGSFPLPYSKPEIVTCEFRNEANLIGALSFYLSLKG